MNRILEDNAGAKKHNDLWKEGIAFFFILLNISHVCLGVLVFFNHDKGWRLVEKWLTLRWLFLLPMLSHGG